MDRNKINEIFKEMQADIKYLKLQPLILKTKGKKS